MENEYGAVIERGEIIESENNLYVVRSLTRSGVITPPMRATDGTKYHIGDRVYFFMFDDGNGRIIAGR